MVLHTPELHAQLSHSERRLRLPFLKLIETAGPVFTGTFYSQLPDETIKAFDLRARWLTVTEKQAKTLISAITSENSRKVWVQEKRTLSHPGILVELPFDTASAFGLEFQRRVDLDGQVHNFEIVIADELISYFHLKGKGIHPKKNNYKVSNDLISLEEGIAAIKETGQLPARKRIEFDKDFITEFA